MPIINIILQKKTFYAKNKPNMPITKLLCKKHIFYNKNIYASMPKKKVS